MCLNFSVTYVGVPYSPSIGPRCAQVPSFHRRSVGRAVRASMPYSANPAPAGLPTTQRFHSAGWHGAFESSGLLGGSSWFF